MMDGYENVSECMAAHPDLAIVRKFKPQSMRSILHMQAELTILESQYENIVKRDIESGKHERLSVYRMRRESNAQWRKRKQFDRLLMKYRKHTPHQRLR